MPEQLIPFLLVAIVIAVVPGPDTALGLRNSLRGGTTAMWWTGIGCCGGLVVHAAASMIGLSALLAASATAYTVVKVLGAAYLVWLGATTLWASWKQRHEPTQEPALEISASQQPITRRAAFRQGLISNLLNPKIVLLFLTLIPQFVGGNEPHTTTSMMLMLVFLGVSIVWWRLMSWTVGAMRRLVTKRRVRLTLERVTGTVMVGLGLRVALDGT